MAADISVCPRVDSASKNEYHDIHGDKGGRCVRVTTLPPSGAECLVIWNLNRPEPSGPHRLVIGVASLFTHSNNKKPKIVLTFFVNIIIFLSHYFQPRLNYGILNHSVN